MSSDDQARANRLKRRCEIRRMNCVNKIRAVYDLAVRSAADSTVVPQLLVLVDTLDQLMSSFNTEDEALLNQLIDMELDAEYPDRECVAMLEMVSFAQATANRLMQYCAPQTILSVHGGSQVALNNADVNEPQTNVHASNGAGACDGSPGGVQSNNAGSLRSNSVQVIKPTRLPEIPLPTFYGDIYKWISFRDRFAAMVDRRSTLSDIEKFYYLVGCCKGDALDAIRGIPVADHNYKLAWSTLKERFDKPRLVACSLIEGLLSAPRASSETLAELNKLLVIFDEGVSVLKSMEIPNLGDFILFSIASRCLPTSSIKLFEAQLANGFPTVQDLLKFVKSRVAILECIPREPTSKLINELKNNKGASYSVKKPPIHSSMVASSNPSQASQSCICCKGTHVLASCPKFKSWTLETRSNWARDQRICFRCLRTGHWVSRCKSSIVCGQCSRRHHSLLHPASSSGRPREENTSNAEQMDLPTTSSLLSQNTSPSVILGTALIHMSDSTGVLHTVRALIDSASQISAITAECSNRLGLRIKKWTVPVSGIGGVSVHNVLGIVQCRAQPRFSPDPVFNFDAWVFSTITTDMPRHPLTKSLVDKYKHLALADPSFAIPGSIDVLLGADLFSEILNGKRVSVGSSYPAAFGTVFGWTIIGAAPHTISHWPVSCPTSLTVSCETMLHKFWEIEEPDTAPEEFTTTGQCESMFRKGCVRVDSGKYSVPLLFRQPTTQVNFTGSRAVATKRFGQLEKKLMSDQRLRSLYCQFMAEYQSDGHMSQASSVGSYFIPHHAVYRPSDTNPKIRVVFDASAKDYSGTSLNDVLFPGPKLQQDVVDVLLLFRLSRFAFTCDISKMYRQILISPEHRQFQHVLWRASPEDELQAFELNTVTYGVNCSPFLAIRVLHQIANLECDGFPFVREALLFHTYVDDICVGADSEAAAIQLQSDLITILRHSGMELKKWTSNIESVLNNVPNEDRACDALSFHGGDSVGSKVLGIRWDHHDDSFNYFVKPETLVTTKRGMLSLIARIFYPLGLLAPVIFQAKHLMQSVWKANMSWDENLPNDILKPWTQFVTDLPELQRVRIPRFVQTRRGLRCVLCGFCDASERGYAAVVYIKSLDFCERPSVSLLGAKTKLAPVKAYTIPRMELCAAVLLARWMARLKNILDGRLQIVDTLAWSDSTTVLSWLKTPHESFKVFVSNRVCQIHTALPECHWNYIASADNPADCASRGLSPVQLIDFELYWDGPKFLHTSNNLCDNNVQYIAPDQLPEIKTAKPVTLVAQPDEEWYCRFSCYLRMTRVVAWMCRFIMGCRGQPAQLPYLTRKELDQAAVKAARASQLHDFKHLLHELSRNQPVSVKPVARLCPFIDSRGLICVGGRLSKSNLPEGQKHPILLAKKSHISLLLVRHWHDVTGHGGPRVLTSLICRQYWILSVNRLIRTVISKCVRCVRRAAVNPQPVMADLPSSRIVECPPFSRVGVDFAGPMTMKEHRLRKSRQYKVYVAVFVCFIVKAVHLEYVSDLSTDAFLAALNRFVARRGMPTDIYTDCGTNFVGAANHMRQLLNDQKCQENLVNTITCTWHFNPPGAPHFGGLWEAAVRSAKTLMVKIMGEHTFTIEEFSTILCRVEAILNSRPLVSTSPDPAEADCLTPGHFLIGRPLLSVPEVDYLHSQRPMVQRWKLLNQSVQSFWHRWRREYLHTLQSRSRWTKDAPNIAVNDVVIVKDLQAAPLKWHMARVTEVIPGSDGIVRVVRLQTATGTLTRPVVKVVKLPTD